MMRTWRTLALTALATITSSAVLFAQVPADSARITERITTMLREADSGHGVLVVPTYKALLHQYGRCRGDSVGANCHLTTKRPVYLISSLRFSGDSAVVRVTRYRDTRSHGIVSLSKTWVFAKRDTMWHRVRIRESETIQTH